MADDPSNEPPRSADDPTSLEEDIRTIAESLRKIGASTRRYQALEPTVRNLQGLLSTIQFPPDREVQAALETVQHMLSIVSQDLDALQQTLHHAIQVAADVLATEEGGRQWRFANQRLLRLLAPRGWLISPSAESDIVFNLLAVFDRSGIHEVERQLLETLHAGVCADIVAGLQDRPAFAAWRDTLSRALRVHAAGDFPLAIPIWLIAIEGVCRVELGIDDIYTRLPRGDRRQRVASQVSDASAGVTDNLVAALTDVIASLGANPDRRSPVVFNRHSILHGRRPSIGDEQDSVQCILVLDVLHWALNWRDAATRSN